MVQWPIVITVLLFSIKKPRDLNKIFCTYLLHLHIWKSVVATCLDVKFDVIFNDPLYFDIMMQVATCFPALILFLSKLGEDFLENLKVDLFQNHPILCQDIYEHCELPWCTDSQPSKSTKPQQKAAISLAPHL